MELKETNGVVGGLMALLTAARVPFAVDPVSQYALSLSAVALGYESFNGFKKNETHGKGFLTASAAFAASSIGNTVYALSEQKLQYLAPAAFDLVLSGVTFMQYLGNNETISNFVEDTVKGGCEFY